MDGLLSDTTVTSWVGKIQGMPNISTIRTPSAQLPAIIVETTYNADGNFADDSAFSSVIRYQITLFSRDGLFGQVPNHADQIMKDIGFSRDNYFPLVDRDTKIYQRIMIYSDEVENEYSN